MTARQAKKVLDHRAPPSGPCAKAGSVTVPRRTWSEANRRWARACTRAVRDARGARAIGSWDKRSGLLYRVVAMTFVVAAEHPEWLKQPPLNKFVRVEGP